MEFTLFPRPHTLRTHFPFNDNHAVRFETAYFFVESEIVPAEGTVGVDDTIAWVDVLKCIRTQDARDRTRMDVEYPSERRIGYDISRGDGLEIEEEWMNRHDLMIRMVGIPYVPHMPPRGISRQIPSRRRASP